MASYTINNMNGGTLQNISTTAGAATGTILTITALTGATTLRRVWVTETEFGAGNVPNATDCQIQYDISKITTVGTATTITPILTDTGGGDAAALGTYSANATAAPTYTASSSVFSKAINQRASDKQWWRDKATCPIIPAVTANGFGFRAFSTNYASTIVWQASVEE